MSLIGKSGKSGFGMILKEPGNVGKGLLDSTHRYLLPVCLLLVSCLTLKAQTGTPTTVGPLLAYATVSVRSGLEEFAPKSTGFSSAAASETEASNSPHSLYRTITADTFSFDAERRLSTISRTPHRYGLLDGAEIVLFRQRMSSHYNYPSWARVDSGYGQWFNGADPIGRTRTSGAGVRDNSWIYVKMSIGF